MIEIVLFDLDGTLLPMDQDVFIEKYMGLLAQKLEPYGYNPKHLVGAVWRGTGAMVQNTGEKTNETVFWESFCDTFGPDAIRDLPLFEEFYAADFAGTRTTCGFAPEAAETIRLLKEKNVRCALATNPLFPRIATVQRIRWAGLDPEDFELVTTYENSRRCKPNPDYYREVAEALGVKPENCLMVGNDAREDMAAQKIGMRTFLLTPCLINKEGADITQWPNGDFAALEAFLKENL